ncbi:ThuA domain-containing protein [Microbacterium xanthum]|uniref:ThuA domain-containing protein n=1 Tax=Microbacterium xanthum TaxID=3079794 RepID=UPI002AD319D9|nr:ThuA domain-containing protein [Microbacterium sp. KSW-48]MDZ8171195.1 ThuA domain-containing protein [Microbacterium sp. KSW-48]
MVRSRTALVVRGGWERHFPVEATEAFLPFLEHSGYQVRVEGDTRVYADAEAMSDIDLLVQCITMSKIEDDEVRGLNNAVQAGMGFAGWHGGIADSFRDSHQYLHLVGGQFAAHPPKPVAERAGDPSDNAVSHTVDITDLGRSHPITKGIESFDLTTEQYWVLTDEYNDVLATTTHPRKPGDPWSREVTCPAVWTRTWGEGKVFVATPGHDPSVLADENVRTIIERGMLWASR